MNENNYDWLLFAQTDYKAAQLLLQQNDDQFLGVSAYHAHQCAEKSFKAYLYACQKHIPKTHDLEYLLRECFFLDASFAELLNNAQALNPFATRTRYPDDLFIFLTQADTLELLQHSEIILNFVAKKIKTKQG